MPALPKTSDEAIVSSARALLEQGEREFSLSAVARAVGIKPPSLYKRFPDRESLVAAVRRSVAAELGVALERAGGRARGPEPKIRAMAEAYRHFGLHHQHLYQLLFTAEHRPDPETDVARARAIAPVLVVIAPLVGEQAARSAVRAFTAFLHGYISMVSAQAFHLGGDLRESFDYGVETILRGLRRM